MSVFDVFVCLGSPIKRLMDGCVRANAVVGWESRLRPGTVAGVRDWRSLPVFRSGLPGPDAEHCTMLILRGPLEEIEGGCAPFHAGHVDVEALESAAGHALSGWTATHMPADAIPRADCELALKRQAPLGAARPPRGRMDA